MRAATAGAAALVLVLALLAAAGSGDDRPVVQVTSVAPGTVTNVVSAPGRVEPVARQDVAAAVSGTVATVDAADGGTVAADQPVVTLTSSGVARALEQAAAAEQVAASAGGPDLDSGGDATRRRVADDLAAYDAATAPRLTEARQQAQAITDPEPRAAALAAVSAAEATVAATRSAIERGGGGLAAQQDALAHAVEQAIDDAVRAVTAPQRAQAEAAIAAASAQADELVVRAPFAGTVQLGQAAASDGAGLPAGLPPELAGAAGALSGLSAGTGSGTLRPGAPVAAGQVLFTVYDLSGFAVALDIDEIDAPGITIGQTARVVVDAFPGVVFPGTVESVAVEAATTAAGGVGYPARVRLTGPGAGDALVPLGDLRVGMTASADVEVARTAADLVVPTRALVRRDAGSVVLRVDAEQGGTGVLRTVPVAVEFLGDDTASVRPLDGARLVRGDRVVVAGAEDLADGAAVRVEVMSPTAGAS